MESLLRTHKDSLRELWLCVETPGAAERPDDLSNDLPALLRRCSLAWLRLLVLHRGSYLDDSDHNKSGCIEQKSAAAAELVDGGQVLCVSCDKPANAQL